jgi:hypothetical protein
VPGAGSVVVVAEPGDMDERVTALENSVSELRARVSRAENDATAARTLAGGADRDVGELGGEFRAFRDQNNRLLSAMRADIVDLRERVDNGFARIAEEFAQVDRNFLAVRGVLDATAAGQQQIVARIDAVLRRHEDDRPPSQ